VTLNALGRLASSLTRRRTVVDLPPPDDYTDWQSIEVTPQSETPIGRQVHGPSPAICCHGYEQQHMTHNPECRMWRDRDLPVRYPVGGPIGGHRG
jgi:hypothetical protein